ncbi:MAG: SDR family oxidoreductase [Acidobacteriota bacterium]
MRILVTGHKGYIGSVMVPMLVAEGHEVSGMDSDLYQRCTFGKAPMEIPFIARDIRDAEPSDFEGIDAVIHLAALSNDPLGDLDPNLTMDINFRATIRVAEAARAAGVRRFLFSSSCSTYGAAGDNLIDETAAMNPVTPYGESKVMAELELMKLATASFSPTFLRSATAYGVSERLRFDLVLNNLVAWAHTTGKIFIKSDGTPWRPIVHIQDISRAFIAAMNAPAELVHNRAFNVGRSEENYRIREIAEIVSTVVPNCNITLAPDGGPDKRCYRVNCDLIRETLPGFKPQWTVKLGAEELYKTCRDVGLKLDEFEGIRFKRIDHIKHLIASGLLGTDLRWKQEEHAAA